MIQNTAGHFDTNKNGLGGVKPSMLFLDSFQKKKNKKKNRTKSVSL